MNAEDILRPFQVVPVVVIDDAAIAVPLAETLLESGLGAIEVTLRTEQGLAAMEQIASDVPDMLVGAGSVRRASQVADVASAGARFVVSPGSSPALLDAVADTGIPFVPGAVTATEMLALLDDGYTLQKFFPAELAGGAKFLKAVGAPIPEVSFMPTGGIGPGNVRDYLSLRNVACVGGSWIAPADLLAARDFDTIAANARDARTLSETGAD